MSSIFITGLSYVNTSGAGGRINASISSPTGFTINNSQEVFVSGATSNRSTVVAKNSSTRRSANNLLLGAQDNGTLLTNLGTDKLTRGADSSLFISRATTSASGRANITTDYDASLGSGIGIVQNNSLLNNFAFTSSDSISNDQFYGNLQLQSSFL